MCAKFPERCGYFELKRNKCDVPVMPMMCCARLGFMVQCFLVESNSLLLKNGSFFFFLLFFLSASQMIYTNKITMAMNTDAANMRGWLGGAMVLGSFKCRGVLLHLHIVGQGPALLSAGAGWVGFFFFF